jgi:MYXO-CTERM domain-containing protein
MITVLVPCTLLLLAPAPSDLYDDPSRFDIGLPPPCTDDTMCFVDTPLCNVETGECVECLGSEHCPEGWICGDTGFCRDACEVAADCEGIEGQIVCHPDTGLCVQCVDASDCTPEEYCTEEGFCRLDLCDAGQTACLFATVVECTADGGPGAVLDMCPEGCDVVDGVAQCVMEGGSSGSSGGGSAGPGSDESGGGTGAGTSVGATMGSAGGTDASGSTGTGIDVEDGDKGCACRAEAPAGSGWAWAWWLVVGAGLVRRRRR